jgi:hypothetical protein
MSHKSITIHWQGPYHVDKNKLGRGDFENIFLEKGGLYLFTGKTHNNEKKEGIRYIGIAEGNGKNNCSKLNLGLCPSDPKRFGPVRRD